MEALAISIKSATQVLGVGRTHLYSLIRNGKIQTVKLGARTLVTTDSLRKLVESA